MRHLGIRILGIALVVALGVAGCDGTETPTPTESPLPSPTPVPTDSPLPTPTPVPTETPEPEPTKVPEVVRVEAESGDLSGPMVRAVDGEASACWYVWSEDWGTGDVGNVLFTFTIEEAGNYRVWGRVRAPDYMGNSFWVSVDGGAEMLWDTMVDGWAWEAVTDRGEEVPVVYSLVEGMHVLRVRTREDGAMLDVLEVATANGYVPSRVTECAATPTVESPLATPTMESPLATPTVESPLASPTPPESPLVATGSTDTDVEEKGLMLLGAAIALVSFGLGGAVGYEASERRWRRILKS